MSNQPENDESQFVEPIMAELVSEEDVVFASVVKPGGINRKYLSPADLRRLSHNNFSSRRAIENLYSGKHKTNQRGRSIEFHDYRQYYPGDEVGHIDWKVFGRSDKLFIKLYEHQSDLTVHLLVDGSRSMRFSGYEPGGDTKYDLACRLAAAIGFLVTKQSDRFSFSVAQEGLTGFQPARSTMNHLMTVLEWMEQFKPARKAELGKSVSDLIPLTGKRDLLCLFSDLLEQSSEKLMESLRVWIQRGGEAIVFQTLHDDEKKLPNVSSGVFIDAETGERMRVDLETIRDDYQQRMKDFTSQWAQQCSRIGIDYNLVTVSQSYADVLEKYFGQRLNRFRVGR